MKALPALLRAEGLLFWRQGFVAAALALSLVWATLLHLLPTDTRLFWFGLVASLDVTAMGLLFGFGLGLLDQQQGVAQAWRLTPVPAFFFSLARTLVLSLLLMLSLVLLAALTLTAELWLARLPGFALMSVQASLIGIVCGRLLRNINQFILLMTVTGPFWALPFFGYAGWLNGPLPWLWPLSASLFWLMDNPWQTPVLLTALTLGGLFWWAVSFWLAERLAALHLGHRIGEAGK